MSVWHISRSRNDLDQWYFIMLPDHQVVSTLLDKVNFYQFSQSEGLPIPVTYLLRNQSDADLAVSKLNFPCILKPTKRTPAWTKNNEQKVYKVADSHEFQQVYKRCSPWADALIVQDWVSGPDSNLYSCNCYFDAESRPLITFTARKLRQWPPEAGISCLGQECRNDTVLNATVELFTKAGFQGLGYVEMKQDALTGKYFILEANVGRPTVRSAIAEAGGVPLLKSAYCDTVGWQLPQNRTQQYGSVKWIHWHYDIRSAYRYWRRGELSLANWRRSWGGPKVYALFTWRDPTPFWYDLVSTAGRLISRARKKFN
jgi:predicted ATP-grasp superfamily ATP-dependent carboligase